VLCHTSTNHPTFTIRRFVVIASIGKEEHDLWGGRVLLNGTYDSKNVPGNSLKAIGIRELGSLSGRVGKEKIRGEECAEGQGRGIERKRGNSRRK